MLLINHSPRQQKQARRTSTTTKSARAKAHVTPPPQRDTAIRCDICEKHYAIPGGKEERTTRVPVPSPDHVWNLWDYPRACPTCGHYLGWVCLWD